MAAETWEKAPVVLLKEIEEDIARKIDDFPEIARRQRQMCIRDRSRSALRGCSREDSNSEERIHHASRRR